MGDHGSGTKQGVPLSTVAQFQQKFVSEAKNVVAQSACVKHNILDVIRRPAAEITPHVFNHKIDTEGKPVTNQHSSGRCWIFALLNCMRVPFCKQHGLDEFEFSQNFLFFWDKVERLNYKLNAFVETARREEPADGRLVQHLLRDPSEDGGQWQMLVNIVEKYGVVPKKIFPDSWTCENTVRVRGILNNKMREFCRVLRGMVAKGSSDADINAEKERMMEEMYRILSICTGSPPDTFTWRYYDKEKKFHTVGPMTPVEFYQQYVKPYYNVADKVVLVNDPRPDNPYERAYTVDYLNNMIGAPVVVYLNQPAEVLKKYAAMMIKNNEPVWFGCDVSQHCSWQKHGIEDLKLYDYELFFGTSCHGMTKGERLLYHDSEMTHAMVFTGVLEETEKTKLWRVENSWSETGGEKGYLAMTDDWFGEYVFEVAIDKKYLPAEILAVLDQQPKVLPAWDPMGALARCSSCDIPTVQCAKL
jgi:bleomycin hydrolase